MLAGRMMEEGPSLAGEVGSWLMGAASSLLSSLPDAGLFLMTTLLAVYFTSLSYPSILAFLKRQLPRPSAGTRPGAFAPPSSSGCGRRRC